MAGGLRAVSGNVAPNHYWDKVKNQPDLPALYEQMEREAKLTRSIRGSGTAIPIRA